jgi:hypothetical protein
VQRKKNLSDGIVKQSVRVSGVKIQQASESGSRELSSNEGDKRFRDGFFGKVALPEDR